MPSALGFSRFHACPFSALTCEACTVLKKSFSSVVFFFFFNQQFSPAKPPELHNLSSSSGVLDILKHYNLLLQGILLNNGGFASQ